MHLRELYDGYSLSDELLYKRTTGDIRRSGHPERIQDHFELPRYSDVNHALGQSDHASATMMKAFIAQPGIRRAAAGQTMVEFAMVATVFLMLMFGVMQMALTVYNYDTVCSAAREAVRYAIVHSPTGASPVTTAQIQQIAINSAVSLNPSNLTVLVSWPTDANLPLQKDAQVKVSYVYQLQIPFMTPISLTLASTSQMLVSQ